MENEREKSATKRPSSDNNNVTKKVAKQRSLFDFGGFTTSQPNREQSIEFDKKRTAIEKYIICEHCGDKFAHKGALKMHVRMKHPSAKQFSAAGFDNKKGEALLTSVFSKYND